MSALVITTMAFAEEDGEMPPSCDPLQDGYIPLGNASAPVGAAGWYDTSLGVSYGDGCRYDTQEIATLTKVPSRHKR